MQIVSDKLRSISLPWTFLLVVWVCIVLWRDTSHARQFVADHLPTPPSATSEVFMQASDTAFVYRLLLLWLQQFDVQSGHYISYRTINYEYLVAWLQTLQRLAPESQYPMLMATRIYTKVADEQKQRLMLDFVYRQYKANPEKNWRWLAEVTITAQHKLKDLSLALDYAKALASEPSKQIPYWARDLQLTILEDMGEYEQIKLLVGGLIANNAITDPNELRFLNILLNRLQKNHN